MNEALQYLYYIYDKFIVFVFDTMEISPNVSIGWIALSVMLFGLLIRSILNIPRQMGSFDKFRAHTWDVTTEKGTHRVTKKRI